MNTPLPGRRSGLAALALALTFAVAACGDDTSSDDTASDTPSSTSSPAETSGGEETTAATGALSKEDFLTQGNAVCKAANTAIEAAGAEVGTSNADIEAFLTQVVVPGVQGQIDALRALGYPEGDQETLEGIYADAEAVLDTVASDPSSLVTADNPFADVNAALTDYGLTECGSSD